MQTRTITGKVSQAQPGGVVTFELASSANTIDQVIQPSVISAPIDASGHFSVILWSNAGGLAVTRYRMRYPNGDLADLYVPSGIDPIDMATINAIASVPEAPSTQQILADLLEQHNNRGDAHPELQAQTAQMLQEFEGDLVEILHLIQEGFGAEGREIVERLAKLLEMLREKTKSWSNQ
jgi:hypothetical protein